MQVNEEEQRFEQEVDGELAFIQYILKGDIIFITHTEVPVNLENRGIASHLTNESLAYIDAHHWRLVPMCPFTAAYIQRHPEWRRLVFKGLNVD